MDAFVTPPPAAKELRASRFSALPSICHCRSYELLRLEEDKACIRADGNLFYFRSHTVIAQTVFRHQGEASERLKSLVGHQNSALKKMGWLHQRGLVLLQPLLRSEVGHEYLLQTIDQMLVEIGLFARKLRANGIWEY